MDRATANFLSAPASGGVMQPMMYSAPYVDPLAAPQMPSLPGNWDVNIVDPSQWTAQAFGAQSQPQNAAERKSVTTSAVYAMPDLGPVQPLNDVSIFSGFPVSATDLGKQISDAFGLFSAPQQAAPQRSTTAAAAQSAPQSQGGPVGSGPAYGDKVQLADGTVGNYAAPGLAMDAAGNYVGWGPSTFDSWGGGGQAAGGGCYLTTAAIEGHEADDGPTLTALRWFRDHVMGGRGEVAEYYATAPRIVAWIDAHPKRDRIYGLIRRCVLSPCVAMIKRGEFSKTYRLYKRMVRFLEARANG